MNKALEEELYEIYLYHGYCDSENPLNEKSKEELTDILCAAIYYDKPLAFDYLISLGADVNGVVNTAIPLCLAAQEGKIAFAKKLVSLGAEVDKYCSKLWTPLHYAVNRGDLEFVKWIVSQGANINALDESGCNPLHFVALAPSGKEIESIGKFLLDKGTDIAKMDAFNQATPLQLSIIKGRDKLAKVFIEKDKAILKVTDVLGFTPLHYACFSGNQELAELFVKRGSRIDTQDKYQNTPLMLAVKRGHQKIVEKLIENGADVEAKNIDGLTPLHSACFSGNQELAELLLRRGAKMDTQDKYQRTALFHAVTSGNLDLVRFLVENGASVNCKDDQLCTPLLEAAYLGHDVIAFYLIEKGADIFAVVDDGNTLLHIVSGYFREEAQHKEPFEEFAIWLVEQGLDVQAKNNHGDLPIHIAAKSSLGLVKYYFSKGVDLEEKGRWGRNTLHWAAMHGNRDVCQFLINAGVPVDLPDEDGYTPLLLASSNQHQQLVLDLLEYDVEVNPKKTDVGTPLLDAVKFGWTDVVLKLIEKGADVNRLTWGGKTVHEIAEHFGHPELADILRKKVDPNKRKIRLFVDSEFQSPPKLKLFQGYDVWVVDQTEAIRYLQEGRVIEISLGDDLGLKIADYIEEKASYNEIPRIQWRIHSDESVEKDRMTLALNNADKYWDLNVHKQ